MSGRNLLAAAALLVALAVLAVLATGGEHIDRAQTARASVAEALSDGQRADVRKYLIENPNVIVEALDTLKARQQAAEQAKSKQALTRLRGDLVASGRDPTLGPDDASVTIVEFFDYQCPYCKRMTNTVMALMREDGDLRLVFKEFPILGEPSMLASRAALAATKQGKYTEFHIALMNQRGQLSEGSIEQAARMVGIDFDRLREDMQAAEITAIVQINYQLAQAIGVTGTPAFIIGDQIIPGAVDIARLREIVEKARSSKN